MSLREKLVEILDDQRVLTRSIDRIAWANDASVYRLVPQAVVQPRSIDEVRGLLAFSRSNDIPLTFRAAGTSLSGQAITDGLLVVVSRYWRELQVLDRGLRVRVQPGVIGGLVNRHLASHGRKIGPDPASINACMMGGILANNSSGMCCGVAQNAYHTLESMRLVLPDGLLVDSADHEAEARLAREAPAVAEGLLALKARIEADSDLMGRIRRKYRMKNTTAYSLNAFIDYARPVDILAHLMIGSEGTLGFIADATLHTVPDYPRKSTGLLFFPDVPRACAAIEGLAASGARALELMDRASLRAIERHPGVPEGIDRLPESAAAVLTEYQCETPEQLDECRRACDRLLPGLPLIHPAEFTTSADEQAALWSVRKGLIPSVGAFRRRGTSFIIEDVVFPLERLAPGVAQLQALFGEHGYDDAIVFGHAKDGNLHFVLTQAFDRASDVDRYDRFMHELARLVAGRHGGALKAEHGCGRNMAPFVRDEWGESAHRIMVSLKRLVDPAGLLNPGVILNDDPKAHVTHLKTLPTVESEVDQCIECGFCEPVCPSRDLTLTPRQRIVVRREMARLTERPQADPSLLARLQADYRFAALDSCATDGMCAGACPVNIDTGALVKRLRRESHSPLAQEAVRLLAERFGWLERSARGMLRVGHMAERWFGATTLDRWAAGWSRTLGVALPRWQPGTPPPAPGGLPPTSRESAEAVYFPSCVTRLFGSASAETSWLPRTVCEVAQRAGVALWIPPGLSGLCCGLPFASKGYTQAYRQTVGRTVGALWSWSEEGRRPVVIDNSPCALTLKRAAADLPTAMRRRFERLQILDSIEFAARRVLPTLELHRLPGKVALHPVCSVRKMQLQGQLRRIAESCAGAAEVPIHSGCCGFAGDRGFVIPELTAAATRAAADELSSGDHQGYYSSSGTCEIGLSRATGQHYRSFWHLLDQASRKAG